MNCTRRRFLAGSAALTGCAPVRKPQAIARVCVARAPRYGQEIYDTIRRLLAEQNPGVRGKRVVLKPNLVEFEPQSVINTNPIFVHAVMEGFRALGAADVRIAEGPGHRRNTLDLTDAAGYFDIVPRFESLFTDLNLDDIGKVRLARPASKLESVYLPKTALGADLLVSIPKMKTHHWVGATLSMKNFFGLVPGGIYGWPKNILHWSGINECIADLHAAFPRTFAIVDGIVGMEGNGPIQGTPKNSGVIVAGRSLPAVDATCCSVMGINPHKIDYLRIAGIPEIQQSGESIASVRTPFELIPQFHNLR